ncbi:unnamed protein product [Schistosoma margrebowiei]|uniref:Uncharacterized protein n=1 Tax=Schistosoma margrebowiei TaxID=48269 RepID=A0A183LQY4_9TREM|nr:unnamed protein product [Schistosoma margrebowiei]
MLLLTTRATIYIGTWNFRTMIHKGRSKILRYNTACTNSITIDGEDLEDVKTFTYLGSIIDEQGASDADVKARIGKARSEYLQLRNIWNSKQLSTNTKQQRTVGENKPDPSGGRNQEEALEVDRTHIEECTQLHYKTSPHMESSRPNEERKTKEHITPGNGNRHEKNEQELDGTRKEGPAQSGLDNACRRPKNMQEINLNEFLEPLNCLFTLIMRQ